jgi:hypothetical protein
LYQAAAEERGLVIRTSDVAYVIRKLKEAQSSLADPDIDLVIIPSPVVEGDVWLIKRPFVELTHDRPTIDEGDSQPL